VLAETQQFARNNKELAAWASEQQANETQQMVALSAHMNASLVAPHTSALEAVVAAVVSQHGVFVAVKKVNSTVDIQFLVL
jgi:hypothetical protein